MKALVTSRTMGVTKKRVDKSGIGGRAGTMAGAAPTDHPYGSTGLPAAYRHPGSLGPNAPSLSEPWVTIDDTIPWKPFCPRRWRQQCATPVMKCDMGHLHTPCTRNPNFHFTLFCGSVLGATEYPMAYSIDVL